MKRVLKAACIGFVAAVLVALLVWGVVRRLSALDAAPSGPAERPPLPVRVVEARRGSIQAWIVGEGTARAVRREFLAFEQPGKVARIGTDSEGAELREGSRVRGPAPGERFGQLLAELDNRRFVQAEALQESLLDQARKSAAAARAAVTQAENNHALTQKNLERARQLHERQVLSDAELEAERTRHLNARAALESARARLEAAQSKVQAVTAQVAQAKLDLEGTRIHAPFDGVITYLNLTVGERVAPGRPAAESEQAKTAATPIVVVDPSRYEITLSLPVYEGALVRPGQRAFVTSSGTPFAAPSEGGEAPSEGTDLAVPLAEGRVYSVSPAISPGGRAIQVKLRTTDGAAHLRDGLFVTCRIVVQEKDDAILAPARSLVYRKQKAFVFVVDPETGTARRRAVREGIASLRESEILEGVRAGDLLVTEGRHRLAEGAPVEVVEVEEAR